MHKGQSTWPPASLRDTIRQLGVDEVYAPNGQAESCAWHPGRVGTYRVSPRSDVPLCDECAVQDSQGI